MQGTEPAALVPLWRLAVTFAVPAAVVAGIMIISSRYSLPGKLTGLDQVAGPGERLELMARLEPAGPNTLPPSNVKVSAEYFRGDGFPGGDGDPRQPPGVLLGSAPFGRNGFAMLGIAAPEEPGIHPFRVRLAESGSIRIPEPAASFLLAVVPATQNVLLVDLDGSLFSDLSGSPLPEDLEKRPPLPGAAGILREASTRYRILYLTARTAYFAGSLRRWLASNRFPEGPVLSRDLWTEGIAQALDPERIKTAACRSLKGKKGLQEIRWGIGGTGSDIAAYLKNEIPAIYIARVPGDISDDPSGRMKVVAGWEEIGKIILP